MFTLALQNPAIQALLLSNPEIQKLVQNIILGQ
jgi:hypothetical protein